MLLERGVLTPKRTSCREDAELYVGLIYLGYTKHAFDCVVAVREAVREVEGDPSSSTARSVRRGLEEMGLRRGLENLGPGDIHFKVPHF